MKHYAVRLNLKTQSQYHRILWTVTATGAELPSNATAGVYEVYQQHISEHPGYKLASDFHHMEEFSPEYIRQMAYAEEHEHHFAWGDLEIELETNGSPMRLQAVAIEQISDAKFNEYRLDGIVDKHMNISL